MVLRMNDFNKDVLQRIDMRIAELGMSKSEFYNASGISSASYAQWSGGKHEPSTKKLANAAKVLNVSLHYLLTGEQKEPPRTEAEAMDLNKKALYAMIDQMTDAELALFIERGKKILDGR